MKKRTLTYLEGYDEDGNSILVYGEMELKEKDDFSQITWAPHKAETINKKANNVDS